MAGKKKQETKEKEILKMAEEKGLLNDYFFSTTFERYQMQLELMKELREAIEKDGLTVEVVQNSGVKTISNPSIAEYNRTANAANSTVSTLIKVLKELSQEKPKESLSDIMNGLMKDD